MSIAGIIFLATPFRGSDAAQQAQWGVLVYGIMGRQSSRQLVDDLNSQDKELRKITQSFAEIAGPESVQIPLRCFYETKKTELLRRLLPPSSASWLGTFQKKSQKIVWWLLSIYGKRLIIDSLFLRALHALTHLSDMVSTRPIPA